jgi:hypothetical protein
MSNLQIFFEAFFLGENVGIQRRAKYVMGDFWNILVAFSKQIWSLSKRPQQQLPLKKATLTCGKMARLIWSKVL